MLKAMIKRALKSDNEETKLQRTLQFIDVMPFNVATKFYF